MPVKEHVVRLAYFDVVIKVARVTSVRMTIRPFGVAPLSANLAYTCLLLVASHPYMGVGVTEVVALPTRMILAGLSTCDCAQRLG